MVNNIMRDMVIFMSDWLTQERITEMQKWLIEHPIDHSYDEACEAYDNDVPPEQLASRCAYDALKGIGKLPPQQVEKGEPMEELYSQLAALAKRYGAKRLVLFGSRARGDNRYNSDIDLAVYGMPKGSRSNFWMDCEELPTLLKFDIVHITDGMNPAFLANIKKDGVTLYAAED